MRPVYETDADRGREKRIARSVARFYNSEILWPLPMKYGADAFLKHKRSGTAAWIEIKRRFVGRDHYPTLILSVSKIKELKNLARETGTGALVCVAWNDRIGIISARLVSYRTCDIVMAGREDRNDPGDMEPCFEIPVSQFNNIPWVS